MRFLAVITLLSTLAFGQVVISGPGTMKGTGDFVFTSQSGIPQLAYYASPSGSGTDCSIGTPCTLAQLKLKLQGHTGGISTGILTCPGGNNFYPLSATLAFTSADSGVEGTPTIFTADTGCTPVISGGVKIPHSWSTDGTIACGAGCTANFIDLSTATYGNFEGLWYNGVRRGRPRTTAYTSYLLNNETVTAGASGGACVTDVSTNASNTACGCPTNGRDFDGDGVLSNCFLKQTANTPTWRCNAAGLTAECYNRFKYSGSDVPTGLHGLGLGDVEIIAHEKWTWSRGRLCSGTDVPQAGCVANDTVNHIAAITGPFALTINQGFLAGHRYIVENISPKVDSAVASLSSGLWYWDRCPGCASSATSPLSTGRLYYLAGSGEDPNVDEVIVPQLTQVMTMDDVHDINFVGITFSHDNYKIGVWGVGEQQGLPSVSAAVYLHHVQRINFTGSTIAHTMGKALEIQ